MTTRVGSIELFSRILLIDISSIFMTFSVFFSIIFMTRVCTHIGTTEVLGLHGSVVGISSKSEDISQVIREELAQSRRGIILRLILHSGESGSHTYSFSSIFSISVR